MPLVDLYFFDLYLQPLIDPAEIGQPLGCSGNVVGLASLAAPLPPPKRGNELLTHLRRGLP